MGQREDNDFIFTAKLIGLICFVILVFGYGVAAYKYKWWPTGMYGRAVEAYNAYYSKKRARNMANAHPEYKKLYGIQNIVRNATATTYKPKKVQRGFTLISMGIDSAGLIDMSGRLRHTWYLPFSRAWPDPPHVDDPMPDSLTFFIDAAVYPNGDLVAVYQSLGDTPYGYGLVKMDKNSRIIWKIAERAHHHVYLAGDGRIYALMQDYVPNDIPQLQYLRPPHLADRILIISPDGKVEKSIPVLEAFMDTPYEQIVFRKYLMEYYLETHDYTHTNSVTVLEPELADKFPMFKPGQLLISSRNLEVVAVIDPDTGKVVWAMQGPWKYQHEAQFLDNGHILMLDNRGYEDGGERKSSRLLEVDPYTGAIVWSYTASAREPFHSAYRGSVQKLPNGNVLTTETYPGRQLMEITPEKEVVWRFYVNADNTKYPYNQLFKAVRHTPDYFDRAFIRSNLSP